ncbi:ATP-binding cassette domain-containing protein [Rhodocyclus tenuis]|uniref:ATPase subunit of ABC transporter with duplicated ATPase domains n=1 Tax=Rhodocyclus tenuis TaxID=1066 RepID=A0A840G013_RHOTE|nr:ATP-binding cassette domain-containing protein [Rhodocyclus tenuis]MBB4247484.1 ATPase subunit of ABC transporter with duplicated ATPase domains [Rhodocyclus tenuis]
MTNPLLALAGVSFVLPSGRTLFSNLDVQFDQRHAGLVGRNGVGKSVLAAILAGSLRASTGRRVCSGSVHYLPQQIAPTADAGVADLASVNGALAALARIEAGSAAAEDFAAVGDRWDIRQRFELALARNGLAHLAAATPAARLSGGEARRVALIGAMLADADFLILDEPSNHLDRPNRLALIEQLQRWPRGLLVISHDRQLLDGMQRILELSSRGLFSYGGNHAFYSRCKAQEQQNALQTLEQCRDEYRREEKSMREQRERQEQRQARGNRVAHVANQASILLGGQKERSENSTGKLRQQHDSKRQQLALRVHEAAQRVDREAPIKLHAPPVSPAAQRRVAYLDAVELPFVAGATHGISLILTGQQRLGVVGANGCGKSTLLKLLAGRLEPLAGSRHVTARSVYLDQRLDNLDLQRPLLEQMLATTRGASEAQLRMRLAQLGLDAQKIMLPAGVLSGGERLMATLASALYIDPPAELLLFDEPDNHLDLPSLQALASQLREYHGALVVVSHDQAFLDSLGLTHRLLASGQGWLIESW